MGKVINEDFQNAEELVDALEKKLTDLGYKFTGQRKLILKSLASENRLFDSEDIFMKVKKIDPSIGIATVYRTLELLNRLKLVCRINIGTEKAMYMLAEDCMNQTSVYMVCDNCRKIITNNDCLKRAIKIRLREDAEKNIFKNCQLKIDNFRIVFSGLCDQCIKTSGDYAIKALRDDLTQ